MDADHLVHMANRIGQFFEALSDRQEAIDGVANHLRRYWAPAMRAELLAHVARAGNAGLHPLVGEALATGLGVTNGA